jgi:hypothetical protein
VNGSTFAATASAMTNPEVRRQKQLTRQRQKLKDKARRAVADKASAAQRQKALAASAPILDCLVPAELNQHGIGNLVFSRALPDGRVAMAVFLLDVFCLGVKNATYATLEADVYARHLTGLSETGRLLATDPACFRKLVEGGVAYANALGFKPHPDYAVARQIFGDLETASCDQEFVYGRDGKPCHVSGPSETLSQSRAIVEQLQRYPGGADYPVPVAGPGVA